MLQKKKRKRRKRMISKINAFLVALFFLILSTAVFSEVIVYPSNGVDLVSSPSGSSEVKISFKPDVNQTSLVKYRLASLQVNGYEVDKSKLLIENIYTRGVKPLDRFQLVLSGKESSNPVISTLKFSPTWVDRPGTYTGHLTSDSSAPDIPVRIVINPKSTLSISPENFKLAVSNTDTPVIQRIDLVFGSNQPKWELYLLANDLHKYDGSVLSKDKIFVRVQGDPDSSWKSLNGPVKIYSGYSATPAKIATLEFFVTADVLEKAGDYVGNIKFLMKSL